MKCAASATPSRAAAEWREPCRRPGWAPCSNVQAGDNHLDNSAALLRDLRAAARDCSVCWTSELPA